MAILTSLDEKKPTTKAPKAKVLTPAKQMEADLKELLLQPFSRRLRYLYGGFSHQYDDFFVMGSSDEGDVNKFANSDHAMGIIRVKDVQLMERTKGYLLKLGFKLTDFVYIDVPALSSILGKVKWDLEKIVVEKDLITGQFVAVRIATPEELESPDYEPVSKVIATPYEDLFTVAKIRRAVDDYLPMFTNPTDAYSHPYAFEQKENVVGIRILPEMYKDSPIGKVFKSPLAFLVSKGMDLLDLRHLKTETPKFLGFRFRIVDGRSVIYAHFAECERYDILEARPGVFLVSL